MSSKIRIHEIFKRIQKSVTFRVVVAYSTTSWLIVEVASIMIPLYDMPESLTRTVIKILFIGFIVLLFYLFSRQFLFKGQGIIRSLLSSSGIKKWATRIIIFSLTLAVIFLLYERYVTPKSSYNEPAIITEPKINNSETYIDTANSSENNINNYKKESVALEKPPPTKTEKINPPKPSESIDNKRRKLKSILNNYKDLSPKTWKDQIRPLIEGGVEVDLLIPLNNCQSNLPCSGCLLKEQLFIDTLTPLMIACYSGDIESVNWLLNNGANVKLLNSNDLNAVHFSAIGGNVEVLRKTIETDNFDEFDTNITSILALSAISGNLEVFKFLLNRGHQLQNLSPDEILFAASLGQNIDFFRFLSQRGISLNWNDKYNMSPLLTSIWDCNYNVTKFLLENGADVNFGFYYEYLSTEMTPLALAVVSNHPDILELILENKPNRAEYGNNLESILESLDSPPQKAIEVYKNYYESRENLVVHRGTGKEIRIRTLGNMKWTVQSINRNKIEYLNSIDECERYIGESWFLPRLSDIVNLYNTSGYVQIDKQIEGGITWLIYEVPKDKENSLDNFHHLDINPFVEIGDYISDYHWTIDGYVFRLMHSTSSANEPSLTYIEYAEREVAEITSAYCSCLKI